MILRPQQDPVGSLLKPEIGLLLLMYDCLRTYTKYATYKTKNVIVKLSALRTLDLVQPPWANPDSMHRFILAIARV